MNIFVASWFFPPATSSEGIVTYKLLRNSRHHYDVFSSTSKQWGYKAAMRMRGEKNIDIYTVETDDISEWVDFCVAQFEKRYAQQKYDCVMTRSTPPESILVGLRIKEKYPQVRWIASLADPVANNPYELKAYVDDSVTLSAGEKAALKQALRTGGKDALEAWEKRPETGIKLLCKLKHWEEAALKQADMIISPTGRQLRYIDDGSWNYKYLAVPHSYDPELYPENVTPDPDKTVFSFIGYSDASRSLVPIVQAVRLLRQNGSPFLENLEIRFVGNNPRAVQDMVLDYYLEDIIKFYPGVEYGRSLELMMESDWLIHVDAFFSELQPGGSIFFAGKLADYMGAGRPIFALTGEHSPAYEIVREAGGVCLLQWDIAGIANSLEQILSGRLSPVMNHAYIESYRADNVAKRFDAQVENLCLPTACLRCRDWPQAAPSADEKLVTICVPSYNVQRYLERCLRTLVDHENAPYVEVLVVDDGSKDSTAAIAGEFEKHYPGIVRLIQKENGGHGSTINRAIAEGRGKYFMVVDGDDWIDSQQFSKLLDAIKSGEISSDVISSNYHHVNMETAVCFPWRQQTEVKYFQEYTFDQLDTENVYFTMASSMFKLDILKKEKRQLQEHTFYVDVEYILFPVPLLKTATFVDYYIYKYMQGNAEQSIHIPTMVARYDHHERVVTSVLNYGVSSTMTPAQRAYYDAIMKRLLFTHYGLCLVYDTDRERGYARCQKFDTYLMSVAPDLAKWAAKKFPSLRIARMYHFNAKRAEHSLCGRLVHFYYYSKPSIKQRMKQNRLLRKLLNNRLTRKIAKSDYFTHGTGYRIKEKVKNILSA